VGPALARTACRSLPRTPAPAWPPPSTSSAFAEVRQAGIPRPLPGSPSPGPRARVSTVSSSSWASVRSRGRSASSKTTGDEAMRSADPRADALPNHVLRDVQS
jgi:hypothetical protein